MNEKLNVRLGNPMVMFFLSFAMLLVGIVIGERWHPSRMHSAAIAAAAGGFTMIQEIVSCFVRRSMQRGGSTGAWENSKADTNDGAKHWAASARLCSNADAVQTVSRQDRIANVKLLYRG